MTYSGSYKEYKKLIFLLFLFVLLFSVIACRPDNETKIRKFIFDLAELAEKRDLDGLMASIAPDFSDYEGRDKIELEKYLSGYLDRYRGVVIHVLELRINITAPSDPVLVEGDILFSSGVAETLRKVFRYFGELYRINLQLTRSGKTWQVSYAEWRQQEREGLFPESIEILRKLFPEF